MTKHTVGFKNMLWNAGLKAKTLQTGLKADENIKKYMTDEEIDACFDPYKLLRHVDTIMARFGL